MTTALDMTAVVIEVLLEELVASLGSSPSPSPRPSSEAERSVRPRFAACECSGFEQRNLRLINVYLRIKPALANDDAAGHLEVDALGTVRNAGRPSASLLPARVALTARQGVTVLRGRGASSPFGSRPGVERFMFTRCFGAEASQQDVYEAVCANALSAVGVCHTLWSVPCIEMTC
jgi:hypothetical protein